MGYFSAVYAFNAEPNWDALASVAPELAFLAFKRAGSPLWLLTCRERSLDEVKYPLAYFPERAVGDLTTLAAAACLPASLKESLVQVSSVLADIHVHDPFVRMALELGGRIHDAVQQPVYFYAADDDGLNMAFQFAQGALASFRIYGNYGIAEWDGELVQVAPHVLDIGDGADPEDVDVEELHDLPLVNLKETAVYDEEEAPPYFLFSVPLALWPAGWPDAGTVLGLGTWDMYLDYPQGYETAYVRV